MAGDSLTSKKYVDGIYIPVGLLIFGTIIVKREWTPYAAVIAVILGAIKYYNGRECPISCAHCATDSS